MILDQIRETQIQLLQLCSILIPMWLENNKLLNTIYAFCIFFSIGDHLKCFSDFCYGSTGGK